MRAIAVARKYWLFARSEGGGHRKYPDRNRQAQRRRLPKPGSPTPLLASPITRSPGSTSFYLGVTLRSQLNRPGSPDAHHTPMPLA